MTMNKTALQEAVAYIRHALALCDAHREKFVACHLQLCIDILDPAPASEVESALRRAAEGYDLAQGR